MSELISFPNETAAARACLSSSYDFKTARAAGHVRIAKAGASQLSFHRAEIEQLRAKNFQTLRAKFAAIEPDERTQLRVTCAHASAMAAGRDRPNNEDLRAGLAAGDAAWRAEAMADVMAKLEQCGKDLSEASTRIGQALVELQSRG